MRRSRGFTLIEILVIIIIIAVMSTVVVPEFRHEWQREQFRSEAAMVRSALVQAREQAINLDTNVTLAYKSGANVITIDADSVQTPTDVPTELSNDNTVTQLAQAAANPQTQTVDIGNSIMISSFTTQQQTPGNPNGSTQSGSTSNQIQFLGDGTCDGASITVTSMYGYGMKYTLTPNGNITEEEK